MFVEMSEAMLACNCFMYPQMLKISTVNVDIFALYIF